MDMDSKDRVKDEGLAQQLGSATHSDDKFTYHRGGGQGWNSQEIPLGQPSPIRIGAAMPSAMGGLGHGAGQARAASSAWDGGATPSHVSTQPGGGLGVGPGLGGGGQSVNQVASVNKVNQVVAQAPQQQLVQWMPPVVQPREILKAHHLEKRPLVNLMVNLVLGGKLGKMLLKILLAMLVYSNTFTLTSPNRVMLR